MRALQICKSLFQKASVSQSSAAFVHSVGVCVVRLVEGCTTSGVEPGVITEATQVLEVLLETAEKEKSKSKIKIFINLNFLIFMYRITDAKVSCTAICVTLIRAHFI